MTRKRRIHRWMPARPLVLALVAVGMATALTSSLVGCVGDGSELVRVFDTLRGRNYTLPQEATHEATRFESVYQVYVAEGRDDGRLVHFNDAFARVRADYVHKVDDGKLIDAAIKGVEDLDAKPRAVPAAELVETALDAMVASLDPHSDYLSDEELREIRVSTKGEFGGLGIEVTMEDGFVKVVSPIENTPAYHAGFKPGDLITHLDGQSIKGLTLLQAVKRMRGRPGSDIRLTVRRADVPPFDVTVTRAVITVRSVRWRTEGEAGYIRVANFTAQVEGSVQKAVIDIRRELGSRLSGIVLDLRNNPGGLLDQSIVLADAFLEDGVIVSLRGRNAEGARTYSAEAGDLVTGLPMVVLINGGSASASEIVAGALQDNGRAVVMGSRSFGKGTVQTITPLPIEGALRLTTALYYAPSGNAIQARGVEPDIVIEAAEKNERKRESDILGALPAAGAKKRSDKYNVKETDCPEVGEKADRQLGCALVLLRAGSTEKFLASLGNRPSM